MARRMAPAQWHRSQMARLSDRLLSSGPGVDSRKVVQGRWPQVVKAFGDRGNAGGSHEGPRVGTSCSQPRVGCSSSWLLVAVLLAPSCAHGMPRNLGATFDTSWSHYGAALCEVLGHRLVAVSSEVCQLHARNDIAMCMSCVWAAGFVLSALIEPGSTIARLVTPIGVAGGWPLLGEGRRAGSVDVRTTRRSERAVLRWCPGPSGDGSWDGSEVVCTARWVALEGGDRTPPRFCTRSCSGWRCSVALRRLRWWLRPPALSRLPSRLGSLEDSYRMDAYALLAALLRPRARKPMLLRCRCRYLGRYVADMFRLARSAPRTAAGSSVVGAHLAPHWRLGTHALRSPRRLAICGPVIGYS